jgi:hypothetical protein
MKYSILLLVLLLAPLARADVYKTVTSDGEVIFSDVPSKGAKRVHLPELTTYKSVPVPAVSAAPTVPAQEAMSYKSFTVTSPQDQATVWDNEGNVSMTVALEPALAVEDGHRVQFYLDGQPYGKADLSMANAYHGLDRGTHTLSASVLDSDGDSLISTTPVTVYLHQASSLHPNSPLNTAK